MNSADDKSTLRETELLVGPRTVITADGDPMVGLGIGLVASFIATAVLESSANPTDGGS